MLNIAEAINLPKQSGQAVTYGNLPGCSAALVLAELAMQHNFPILVITPDNLSAQRLEDEIHFFLGDRQFPLIHFPDWETLPYDHFSPHHTIISQRIKALYDIGQLSHGIVIAPVNTLLQRIAPPDFVQQNSFALHNKQFFDLQAVRERCVHQGYYAVQQVLEPGEFCLRGGIFDIFPMGSPTPYRIEIFDDEVESIRTFDPETQRTIERIESISLLPAREFPVTDASITLFRQQWRDHFTGNPGEIPLYRDISKGIIGSGIEYYLPLFFEQTTNFLDHLPQNTLLAQWGDCHKPSEQFWLEITERHYQCNIDRTRPMLEPSALYFSTSDFFSRCKQLPQLKLQLETSKYDNFEFGLTPPVFINHKSSQPLEALQQYLADNQEKKILFCAESPGRREKMLELFSQANVVPEVFNRWNNFISDSATCGISVAPLEHGIVIPSANIVIITETQLFGEHVAQQRRRKQKTQDIDNVIRNLAELKIGAAVVHVDHGVGRYLGLECMQDGDIASEYLTLEYADGGTLYVPISALHLISRYGGLDAESAPLDKLGSGRWQKVKDKAAKQIKDVAAKLLEIYAKREHKTGIKYTLSTADYNNFACSFPFEETPDQEQAIQQVIDDMCSEKRMDRLVCGDVGFGKTEVAMRAAFIAICNQKQVAVLVPTTLLAQQHFTTFQDRFADWPVTIECLSRFRTAKEQQTIMQKLQAGKVDIVVGTHKLIQPDVKYDNLGLVIIDEEHRFGVQQKDRFKQLRAEVDILTLTATPIPRTLNMAMSQVRDLSIIATPPAKRLAVKTFIQVHNTHAIREAIMREILRGGQVFFLHNSVESIDKVARELAEFAPEARIEIAHGQMRERQLEKIMSDFYHQRFNVLVCTTIIENGIDIPTANTIVIDRADHFGLAQLHQLRGRVGRSHHQAYAYLLTRPVKLMTRDAKKRLDAFATLDDLGAGFMLATHDLEIRGAGELLGEEQSGHIQTIGLTLYTELLNKAVSAIQQGGTLTEDAIKSENTVIDIKISALIPGDFIVDVHERLLLYKRIANADTDAEIDDIQEEMIDRFGLLPKPIHHLFAVTKLKLQAERLGVQKLDATLKLGRIEFKPNPAINPMTMVTLIQTQGHIYKLLSASCLQVKWQTTPEALLQTVADLLTTLQS